MLVQDVPTKSPGRRTSLAQQARALAVVLREEFGIPFVFYDAASGVLVWDPSADEESGPDALATPLDADMVAELNADGRARVLPVGDGCFYLSLLLWEAGKPILIAAGAMPALAVGRGEGHLERTRLQKWLQSFSDRLRLADQFLSKRRNEEEQTAQATLAWETILTLDHLIRRLRIHKEPVKNQQRILDTAQGLLGAESLIWVPHSPDAPVLIIGEPILAPPDCRQLATSLFRGSERRPGEPFLCNDFATTEWADRFSSISNVLGFVLADPEPLGWILALNKRAGQGRRDKAKGPKGEPVSAAPLCPFRRSDAALLTPFIALLELHSRSSARYQDLKELLVGLARSLTAALDAKDSYTFGHSERVARIAIELGRELGMQGDELSDIYLAGLLHDVGKIGVRDAVLAKVEPLTVEEFEHIKTHVTIGYAILSDLRPIRNLLPGVLYHHERYDGKGYPDGLAGEAIPLLARILAVADAYDAMSTTRPYRTAMPCRKVEDILLQGSGTQWDKRVIDAFVRCRQKIHTIRQRGVGDSLQLAIEGALRIDRSTVPHGQMKGELHGGGKPVPDGAAE